MHPRSPSTYEQTRPLEAPQRAQATRYQPPTKDRGPASQAPVPSESYDRAESVQGFSVQDSFTTALKCSALPDAVQLVVRGFSVTIRMQDELGRDPISFDLLVGQPYETFLRRRIIQAQNITPGSAGILSVVAKYSYPTDTELARGEIAAIDTDPEEGTYQHPN